MAKGVMLPFIYWLIVFKNTIPLCEMHLKGILLEYKLFRYVTSHPIKQSMQPMRPLSFI